MEIIKNRTGKQVFPPLYTADWPDWQILQYRIKEIPGTATRDSLYAPSILLSSEPRAGLEPATYALRMRCSTNWAISALVFVHRNLDVALLKTVQN